MHRLILIQFVAFFVGVPLIAIADTFENISNKSWANTPKGKFECSESKTGKHILKMSGKVIFQGNLMAVNQLGGFLKDGLKNANIGCPQIISSNLGYVVVVRDVQPPHYGIQGYAVINFNDKDYLVTELGEGQSPRDESVPEKNRIRWGAKGFTLVYFGYPMEQQGGSADSPKARMHTVRYDFRLDDARQVR